MALSHNLKKNNPEYQIVFVLQTYFLATKLYKELIIFTVASFLEFSKSKINSGRPAQVR